jgi:nucleoside-diphosphate-sugar epimerase
VEDLVEAILLAVAAPGAANETLLLSGGAATPEEIVRALRTGAGRAPRLLPAPSGLVGVTARLLKKDRAWDNLRRDFVLDTALAGQALGWEAKRDLQSRLGALPGLAPENAR